jgi:hypothetical protein
MDFGALNTYTFQSFTAYHLIRVAAQGLDAE